MKFNKLELHNIASIEDAVIDFNQKPLADTDLFLITGTTGAGKTTILDGISLALYNTTPRIAKGMTGKESANKDNLTGDDPRNIVRQNTAEAFSRLYFTGNDDKEYCAEWSVERGKRRKVDAALSNAVWTITQLASGESVSADNNRKYGEVEEVVKRAVGLDFHQFCRTTMLAQGEFTEFLKSDEKDKAAILEKISGSDIYRKIGMEIHRKFNDAVDKFNKEDAEHNKIIVMDDDLRAQKENELKCIDADLPELQKQIEIIQSCINWLNEEVDSTKKLSEAKMALDEAQAAVQTKEFIANETEVKQWKETIDVRQSRKNSINGLTKAEAARKALSLLKVTFADGLAGEAYLNGLQSKLTETIQNLDQLIEGEKSNITAYGNSQAIDVHINNFKLAVSSLQSKTADRKKCEDVDIPSAKKACIESSQKLAEASKAYEITCKSLEEVNGALADLNLNGLREEKDFLKEVVRIKDDIQTHVEKIEAERKSLAEGKIELDTLNAAAEHEKAELERLRLEHERRSETINEFAKLMRSKLNAHLGDADNVCPVCGQHVASLQTDAVLDQEYTKIKSEYDQQQKKTDEAAKAATSKANLLTLTQKVLEETIRNLTDSESELNRLVSSREDALVLAESSKEEICECIEAILKKIAQGVSVEDQRNSLQEQCNKELKAKGEAERLHVTNENAVKTVEQNLLNLNKEITEKNETISGFSKTISDELAGSAGWTCNWKENPDEFVKELKDKARVYESYVSDRDEAQKKYAANEPVLTSILKIKSEVMSAMPEWSADNIIPAPKDRLQDMWIGLNANVKTQLQSLKSATDEHIMAAKMVNDFIEAHEGYTAERLDQLEMISSEAHNRAAENINAKHNNISIYKTQVANAEKDSQEHLAKRPAALKESDTVESLAMVKAEIESHRDKKNVTKGALETEIKNDDEARKKKGDTTLLEQLAQEKEKWARFHKVFGDANGAVLCKIAQSYVLGSLLNSANHHLKSMAPRYRLLVTPGTLNLKLEDKYNGYSTRSTNSISGGESFLVSLALALALADFGQHLGVSTLFIDEGFGTLSGEALQSAINTLKALHSSAGRQVGIISHREEIRESIPVKIEVKASSGSSASSVNIYGF